MRVEFDVRDVDVSFPLHVGPAGVIGFKEDTGAHFGDLLLGVLEVAEKKPCGFFIVGALFIVPAGDDELTTTLVHEGNLTLESKGPVGGLCGRHSL